MKLIGFSAKNYRSISTAYNLPLTDYSVIVGPNNEGKSNILKGLGLALSVLTGTRSQRFRRPGMMIYRSRSIERFDYDWERDFPINLQKTDPDGRSEFTCEFKLSTEELEEFRKKTQINLSTSLKSKITIGKELDTKFDYLMKGRGKSSLNKKRPEITDFLSQKLILQYIPAIRTSALAINIVENLLEKELSILEDNPEYQEVIKTINRLQKPIFNKIAKSLKESIKSFIPDVQSIKINNRENVGRLINSSCKIYIDDGAETDLQLKGDGVISLTAISLLQHFGKQGSLDKGLILLLEEPESHLHPKAIHYLKKVLYDISNTNQVILTTHSPIMIDRLNIKQNIIVQNGKAAPAKSVDEIRQSLGVMMADNLSSAYLVLLVEGEEDVILLKTWLEEKSVKIKSAFEDASLIIDHLVGASNVGYKTTLYKSNLCNVIAYLDDDEAGRNGIENALSKGVIKDSEYVLSSCIGMKNSEIEDLIDINCYSQLIMDDYSIDLKTAVFKNSHQQWSNRVRDVFKNNGKIWSRRLETEIKYKIAKRAAEQKLSSLNEYKKNSIESLVKNIEKILDRQK